MNGQDRWARADHTLAHFFIPLTFTFSKGAKHGSAQFLLDVKGEMPFSLLSYCIQGK